MTKKPSFKTVLTALEDTSTAFPSRYLEHFSDLAQGDLAALMQSWPGLPQNRKRTLMQKLAENYQQDTLAYYDDLAAGLLNDPDEQIRFLALRLLVDSDDTRILPRLVELAEGDPSLGVQTQAAAVLGSFVESGELEDISAEARILAEECLLRLSRVENAELQRAALESLGYSSRPEAEVLINNAFKKPDSKWVASALAAMGHSANEQWEELVLSKLDDPHNEVRRNAVQAAGLLRMDSARQFLLDLLEDEEDTEVFAAAVWSLSQIGGEDVRVTLETLLDQAEDDDSLDYIEEALANLDFTEEMSAFDLLAIDPDEDPKDQP
jgi:HEAT repeat protein